MRSRIISSRHCSVLWQTFSPSTVFSSWVSLYKYQNEIKNHTLSRPQCSSTDNLSIRVLRRPTQPPVQKCTLAPSPGAKHPGHSVYHPQPHNVEFKNEYSSTSTLIRCRIWHITRRLFDLYLLHYSLMSESCTEFLCCPAVSGMQNHRYRITCILPFSVVVSINNY